MRYAGGELAKRSHFFGLDKLRLGRLQVFERLVEFIGTKRNFFLQKAVGPAQPPGTGINEPPDTKDKPQSKKGTRPPGPIPGRKDLEFIFDIALRAIRAK